jgi:hypothetical protein
MPRLEALASLALWVRRVLRCRWQTPLPLYRLHLRSRPARAERSRLALRFPRQELPYGPRWPCRWRRLAARRLEPSIRPVRLCRL